MGRKISPILCVANQSEWSALLFSNADNGTEEEILENEMEENETECRKKKEKRAAEGDEESAEISTKKEAGAREIERGREKERSGENERAKGREARTADAWSSPLDGNLFPKSTNHYSRWHFFYLFALD